MALPTLGAVESLTGGLFASKVVNNANVSHYFRGSLVLYDKDLKAKIGVNVDKGVINSQAALDMAKQGQKWLGVDICVAFTGNAGPTSQENRPVGEVYVAINEKVWQLNLKGDRNQIRAQAVNFAFKKLSKTFNWPIS
ncbi:CinA family protein [Mycoplasma sp. ATU-Cv-703]|uniref:nicotinamide-nucleotide amidohydrolase family protein n=1 Tax=Mycoplasma sp. ATU-Cv-703 TaxID=2498595 RepID=UPI000FDD1BD1